MWAPTGRRGRRRQRAGRPRLPRERDEKLESVMGRGETYETDVNFERRAREVYQLLVVETSRPGGDSAGGGSDGDGGGRRRRLQTRDPGRYQPRANQTSTDHSQNIHLKCPRWCPSPLLRCNAGPPTTDYRVCSHPSTLLFAPRLGQWQRR